jgi:hypothetical protein
VRAHFPLPLPAVVARAAAVVPDVPPHRLRPAAAAAAAAAAGSCTASTAGCRACCTCGGRQCRRPRTPAPRDSRLCSGLREPQRAAASSCAGCRAARGCTGHGAVSSSRRHLRCARYADRAAPSDCRFVPPRRWRRSGRGCSGSQHVAAAVDVRTGYAARAASAVDLWRALCLRASGREQRRCRGARRCPADTRARHCAGRLVGPARCTRGSTQGRSATLWPRV